MSCQQEETDELATLLEQHIDEIAVSWAEKVSQQLASLHPAKYELDLSRISTTRGLRALIDALRTGSYSSLEEYLSDLSHDCLRSGLETGEVVTMLLLCKGSILEVARCFSFDPPIVWQMISRLDVWLSWMVGNFIKLSASQMNRRRREQQEHIVSMITVDAQDPDSIDMDRVLRQVAEGIMTAVQADHCDFYLMDESQRRLIPKWGVRRSPPSSALAQHFLSTLLDPATDVFMREVLERNEPSFLKDVQNDPRVKKEVAGVLGAKSVLVVPLVVNGRALGLAVTGTFDDYRTFTEGQVELAWDVARVATLVIENARLHQQARHMAALVERERLSWEIHDSLAQALSALKLQASYVEQLLQTNQQEQAQIHATAMKRTASEAQEDAREAIFGLRHSASSQAEIVPMLQARLERFRKVYGMDARLVVQDESLSALPTATVVQLTQIIQEALANVRKHANAKTISVYLARSGGHLIATVEDDGKGFDFGAMLAREYSGVGLQIMHERAQSVGGDLEIATSGEGTRVVVRVPVEDER